MVGEFASGHLTVCQLLTPFGDRHGQDFVQMRRYQPGASNQPAASHQHHQDADSMVKGSLRRQRSTECSNDQELPI